MGDRELMPEFDAWTRVGFDNNQFVTSLYSYKSIDNALRVITAIALTAMTKFTSLHINDNEVSMFIARVKYLPLIQFRNPTALFFGWLAQNRGFNVISNFVDKNKSWTPNFEPLTKQSLFKYFRFWQANE